MQRKLLISLLWFPLTLSLIITNLYLLSSLTKKTQVAAFQYEPEFEIAAAAATGTEQVLGASVKAADARGLLLESFLRTHESPLTEYADYILDRADYYAIDFRLVPAIAMCESNAGKRIPSSDSFNAWGISVETGKTSGAKFTNWLSAIDWVSRYLKEKYISRGITELTDIGAIYAPPSVENGNSWANCVSQFMESIHTP